MSKTETPPEQSKDWPNLSHFATSSVEDLPELYDGFSTSPDWRKRKYCKTNHCYISEPRECVGESIHNIPHHSQFVALVDNINTFLVRNGVKEIEFPKSYTQISEWSTVITELTQNGGGLGYGLSQETLRGLIRLTNGKGRINKHTRIFQCEDNHFLAVGPKGAFILLPNKIYSAALSHSEQKDLKYGGYKQLVNKNEVPLINGDLIPEEDPEYQRAVERFIDIFNTYSNAEIAGYDHFDHHHYFTTNRDQRVRATLSAISEMEESRSNIIGEYQHTVSERGAEEQYQAEIGEDDIRYDIGDIIESPIMGDQYVIGYLTKWDEREYIYSGGMNDTKLKIIYVCFVETDKYDDRHDIEINREEDTVATFSWNH